MKITAALIAAALAVSRVQGLPTDDSDTNLVAARSDLKLDGGTMLQAAKRSTDTDLRTRQPKDDNNETQQTNLPRATVQLKDKETDQRSTLSKRAPGIGPSKLASSVEVPSWTIDDSIARALDEKEQRFAAWQAELKAYERGGISDEDLALKFDTRDEERNHHVKLYNQHRAWQNSLGAVNRKQTIWEAEEAYDYASKEHQAMVDLKDPEPVKTLPPTSDREERKKQLDDIFKRVSFMHRAYGPNPLDPRHQQALKETDAVNLVAHADSPGRGKKVTGRDRRRLRNARKIVESIRAREAAEATAQKENAAEAAAREEKA